ncbi:MAG TPA: serine protease [Candidatus Paceibacterota bacterium]|nr:serine protease [Candidatus Paceibacterota bacterium]HMO82657.1 serine protease [Candidatus Paceibacterota bacterium]
MQFLTDLVVAIITAYLAFTNQLADKIIDILPSSDKEGVVEESDSAKLNPLPTKLSNKSLPDILLRSAAYQRASAITAIDPNQVYAENPTDALVNIFCTFITETTIRTTTGSGFFIHNDGVILTNAHVAQYLLLGSTDILGEAECIVRQGNPAEPKYLAELLYIPPTWVQENAGLINDAEPIGTGERDYALLYVTKAINNKPLPETFPTLAFDADLLPRTITNKEVTAVGYPAGSLLRSGPSTNLLPVSSNTTISELYTFGSNYADVFSIRGSQVGEEGSSGGPILNKDGSVIGIIVTRGDDARDGAGSLRAITTSYIHRTILEETGFSLARNVSGNLASRAEIFANTLAPFMINLLSKEILN